MSNGATTHTIGTREPFTYVDDYGITIHAYRWHTDSPRAIVQIAHGIGEHALRYDAFAQALAAAGFAVYADDHRGHGATGMQQHDGDTARLGRLGPGGLRATEQAIRALTAIARDEHPGIPLVMFGHSWGSLMTQRIINESPREFDGVILSGSAYRTPRFMESGALNKRWSAPDAAGSPANGFEWLSTDPESVARFIADPLCFEANILKLFGLPDALRLFGVPDTWLASDVPMLIASGADDPLSKGNGLERLATAYRRAGVQDVTLRVYLGKRHELLNETNRNEVTEQFIGWISDRFAPGDEAARDTLNS